MTTVHALLSEPQNYSSGVAKVQVGPGAATKRDRAARMLVISTARKDGSTTSVTDGRRRRGPGFNQLRKRVGGSRTDLAADSAVCPRDLIKDVRAGREDPSANDIVRTGTCLSQRGDDDLETPLGLTVGIRGWVGAIRHQGRCCGHVHVRTHSHRPGEAQDRLIGRPRRDEFAFHRPSVRRVKAHVDQHSRGTVGCQRRQAGDSLTVSKCQWRLSGFSV